MEKEKEKEQLKIMPLGMAMRWRAVQDVEEMLPNGDPVKTVLQSMLRSGICGISALVPIKGTKSTSEWDKKIIEFLKMISMAAKLSDPVLIVGKSGSGKESMARVIHEVGRGEKNKKFITMDCTSIPEHLVESELFGHMKGAFTEAIRNKTGYIKQAEGGTCFIDELGKMPRQSQNKLLRCIEYKTFRPVGAEKDENIQDVRFVVALQPGDMDNMDNPMKILPDLRNRLNPYTAINLPPLKDRLKADPNIIYDVLKKLLERKDMQDQLIGDISHLKNEAEKALEAFDKALETKDIYAHDQPEHVLKKNQKIMTQKSFKEWKEYLKLQNQISLRKEPISLSDDAFIKLVKYEGYDEKNFRELENILEYSIIAAHNRERKEILVEDLPSEVRSPQTREVKKTSEMNIYDVKNIPLRKIIDHSNEIRASIVRKKIEEIYRNGKEIKTVLSSEGIKTDSGYTGIRNKLERILEKDSLKEIRKQFKRKF